MKLIQLNVLEIHPWNCKVDNIEKPDMIVFDLDPGKNVTWPTIIDGAWIIKEELEQLAQTRLAQINSIATLLTMQQHMSTKLYEAKASFEKVGEKDRTPKDLQAFNKKMELWDENLATFKQSIQFCISP